MSQKEALAKLVAEIATTFTDKQTPTSAEILVALNRAAAGGFAIGVNAGADHMANVINLATHPREKRT